MKNLNNFCRWKAEEEKVTLRKNKFSVYRTVYFSSSLVDGHWRKKYVRTQQSP